MTSSTIAPAPSNRAAIGKKIKAAHEAALSSARDALAHAMDAGDLLETAKQSLPHGEWMPWVEANCGISTRTARQYMQLARNRAKFEGQNGTELPICEARKLIAAPPRAKGPDLSTAPVWILPGLVGKRMAILQVEVEADGNGFHYQAWHLGTGATLTSRSTFRNGRDRGPIRLTPEILDALPRAIRFGDATFAPHGDWRPVDDREEAPIPIS